MIELFWEIGWYGSAVWLGWAAKSFWQAYKRRAQFRELVGQEPEDFQRMITALRLNNESLRSNLRRKEEEIARLSKRVEHLQNKYFGRYRARPQINRSSHQ